MRIQLLTPAMFLQHGLRHAGVSSSSKHDDIYRNRDFQMQYGAPALALTDMWYDLQTMPGALSDTENSLKG